MFANSRNIICLQNNLVKMPSPVWNGYFEKVFVTEEGKLMKKAKCIKCSKILCLTTGTTSGLLHHVLVCWKIDLSDMKSTPNSSICSGSSHSGKSLSEKIACFAAVDGWSMHSIAHSEDLRETFAELGQHLPQSPATIRDIIKTVYNDSKKKITEELAGRISNGDKFSLTLDEWASVTRKRYLTINVHNEKTYNLGLMRIKGSCSSDRLQKLVSDRLLEFAVNLECNIVGATTDGCNFMLKFGRKSQFEHWVCQNHTNHLAVCDFLCKDQENIDSSVDNDDDEDFEEVEQEIDDEEIDGENDEDLMSSFKITLEAENEETESLAPDILQNLQMVRAIVNSFRGSDIANLALQKYVKEEHEHELELIKDVKCRWNSYYKMIKRFLDIEGAVRKALKELKQENMLVGLNVKLMSDLVNILEPVVLVTAKLEAANANIIQVDIAMEKLCNSLQNTNTKLSLQLLKCIRDRYLSRRNQILVSTARFLHDPNFLKKEKKVFPYNTKTQVIAHAKKLMKRLYPDDFEDDDSEPPAKLPHLSFEEELEQALSASNILTKDPKSSKSFASELRIFETQGTRTINVSKLFKSILTIQATSSEAERVFSIAAKMCTKVRSRLSDDTINALVFLKYFFKRR